MKRFRTTLSFAGALALSAFVLQAGCATTVPKTEAEQAKNPVKEMHQELKKEQAAQKNQVEWYAYEDALVKARKEGKFVMVDFYATWCKWCKKLASETYTDPAVVEALKKDFVPVKIDAESGDKVVHEMQQMTMANLAEKYGVSSYPSVWFVDKDGAKAKLLNGYLPPQDFLTYLKYIQSGAYKKMEFEVYAAKGGGGK